MRAPAVLLATLCVVLSARPVRSAEPKPVLLDRIAAVVNDEVITLSEVDGQIPPARLGSDQREHARREALERLIEATLISQEAARANITVSRQEVDAEIAAVRERERLSEEDLAQALAAEGLTLEEYRERLADNIRRAKAVSRLVRGSLTIPDARLKAYYEANVARFTPPASLHLRLLLLAVRPGSPDAELAAARAEAQALRVRAIGGESFADLVRAHSDGPAAADGGDLGVMKAGELDPRFEEAVRALEPGQVSSPVVVEGGVALLQLVARSGGKPQPFEQVRDQIYRILYDEEFEKALGRWVKELRSKAHVEVKL